MEFLVIDRKGIEDGVFVRSAYVVISIYDPDREKPRVKKQAGLRAVLQLAFHDAEPTADVTAGRTPRVMSADQADQIWRFIDEHRDNNVETVVVHCESGVSRSPAVAAALCAGLGGDEARFLQEFQPNRYVYGLVRDAARNRGSTDDLWKDSPS